MADKFENVQVRMSDPGYDAFAITPNDSADLEHVTRGLYIGTGGDLTVDMAGRVRNGEDIDASETILFANVAAGTILPIRVKRVDATGTTAQNIVGIY